MCGIYGTTLLYTREVIKHKLELMNFRGPDHTGIMEIDGEFVTSCVIECFPKEVKKGEKGN